MYAVYILASITRVLYVGMSSDLRARVYQHRTASIKGFTTRYKVNRLVHYELYPDVRDAITRERQLKGWLRKRKIELVEAHNPEWEDLADRIGLPASATADAGG